MRAILAVALLLGGCQFIPGSDEAEISDARQRVTHDLLDADSAKFRDERVVKRPSGDLVCGEVNSKNRMGAYVGFAPYAFDTKKRVLQVYPSEMASNEEALAMVRFPDACLPHKEVEPFVYENMTNEQALERYREDLAVNSTAP
jgi:hypothetical protein